VRVTNYISALYALRTIRTSDYSYPGLFVLWVDYSYLRRFVRWTIRTLDYSYDGLFVPRTIRTMDCSYHNVKYSHINCWCEKALTLQAVCQMQVDLGARLVICMCSCGIGYFVVIIAKLTSSCLLFHIFLVFIFYRLAVGMDFTYCRPLTAAVSFAADIHKSSFDQASSYS